MSRRQFLVAKPERVPRLERVQILVINSSEKAAQLIKNIFHQIGFAHVVTAQTAAEAVFAMKQMRIDMIMVDSQLYTNKEAQSINPEWESISGIDFIKRLRHASGSPNRFAPAMMLVDGLTQREIFEARDAGINEVVMKPLSAKDFCARVTQAFDKPRNFITAPAYKGPCRRRKAAAKPEMERRTHEVRLIRHDEVKTTELQGAR